MKPTVALGATSWCYPAHSLRISRGASSYDRKELSRYRLRDPSSPIAPRRPNSAPRPPRAAVTCGGRNSPLSSRTSSRQAIRLVSAWWRVPRPGRRRCSGRAAAVELVLDRGALRMREAVFEAVSDDDLAAFPHDLFDTAADGAGLAVRARTGRATSRGHPRHDPGIRHAAPAESRRGRRKRVVVYARSRSRSRRAFGSATTVRGRQARGGEDRNRGPRRRLPAIPERRKR